MMKRTTHKELTFPEHDASMKRFYHAHPGATPANGRDYGWPVVLAHTRPFRLSNALSRHGGAAGRGKADLDFLAAVSAVKSYRLSLN